MHIYIIDHFKAAIEQTEVTCYVIKFFFMLLLSSVTLNVTNSSQYIANLVYHVAALDDYSEELNERTKLAFALSIFPTFYMVFRMMKKIHKIAIHYYGVTFTTNNIRVKSKNPQKTIELHNIHKIEMDFFMILFSCKPSKQF